MLRLLVIHGIGQQRRYQTVETLARALTRRLQEKGASVHMEVLPPSQSPGGKERVLRIQWDGPKGRDTMELQEFYWAHIVAGHARLFSLVSWFWHLFRPSRRSAIWDWLSASSSAKANRKIARDIRLFATAALLSAGLAAAAASVLLALPFPAAGGGLLLALCFLEIPPTVTGLRQATRWRRDPWVLSGTVVHGAMAAGAGLLGGRLAGPWLGGSAAGALLVLLAASLGRFLRDFVGDIFTYVNRNELLNVYTARERVLREGTNLLRWCLEAERAHEVVVKAGTPALLVIGHSLGAVVGLDLLRNTFYSLWKDGLQEHWRKSFLGFVTMGAPLRKVAWMYAVQGPEMEAWYLENFGKSVHEIFAHPERKALWKNFLYEGDPVADYLEGLRTLPPVQDVPLSAPRRPPLALHQAYWEDPRILDFLVDLAQGRVSQ